MALHAGRRRRAAGRAARASSMRARGSTRRRSRCSPRRGARVRALERWIEDAAGRPALARRRARGGRAGAGAGRPRAAGARPRGGRRAASTGCCSGSRRRARWCRACRAAARRWRRRGRSGFARPDAVAAVARQVALPVLVGAAALKGLRLLAAPPGRAELATRALAARPRACAATLAALPLARGRARRGRSRRGRPTAARSPGAPRSCARIGRDERRLRRPGWTRAAADRGVARARRRAADDRHRARLALGARRPGHYAAVLEIAPNLGIALCTDGVGSKLIVAEQTGRYDTVGIDCVAMNVNDIICVGAEPIALVDYLAVEQADPSVLAAIGDGAARPAPRRRASRSPAARSRCCPS